VPEGAGSRFPQYALMFLLRRDHGIHSLPWYKLAGPKDVSRARDRTRRHWDVMRKRMGGEPFKALQTRLREAGFREFRGEPELFCWHPETGHWFFAETKRKDRLSDAQRRWFHVCREALGDLADLRVYRLVPTLSR